MAFYYYDDYDPGPSYYNPEPVYYAPSVHYDAYYDDPGPEPAYDDYHPASYDDAHGSQLHYAENPLTTPYDFLADEPLPDDPYEADYADPGDTDYNSAAQSPVYAADSYLAPYDFLADQPLDWEDDDDIEAPYAAGFAVDAADDVGTPLGQELSCAGDGEHAEDDFADEYDAEADRLAAAFDATMRGIPISEAYGLGPQQDHALVGDGAATDASYRGRSSHSFTEEYNAEADQLAAEFDMCWQFGIPIPRAWKDLEASADALEACEDEDSGVEDGLEAVDEPEECVWRRREHEYVAGPPPSPSSFYTDPYHDNDALYDDEYAPYAPHTDFWTGACTLDDRLHALAMQSTARRLAFEYETLPDPIPHLRPLSPYPEDDPAPEFDDAAYEYDLGRYHDAFAALARTATMPLQEPAPLPFGNEAFEPAQYSDEADTLQWSEDDEERLQACINSFAEMQLAGYYPHGFDATPLILYNVREHEQHLGDTVPAHLVSDAYRSFPHHRLRPPRIPRFRIPRLRNMSPPRRKRPPDKPQRADAFISRRNRRQPRSRTPTRPRRDPPPHLSAEHPRQNQPEFVDTVALPDEAVPPDRPVPVPKVADPFAVVRKPVPPDKRGQQLTVEQRRRNALRRIARKKLK